MQLITMQPDAASERQSPSDEAPPTRAPLKVRVVNLVTVLIPFVGLIAAISLLWGVAFNWIYLALLGGMYALTAVGVTVGYHRYFTHRSFKTSRPVAAVLAALGSMAVEGPVIQWAAVHRRHHQHSDDHDDPHSPHAHGEGLRNMLQGFVHAHFGWLFRAPASDLARYTKDLRKERLIRWMSRMFPVWVLLGLLIPTAIAGVVTQSWTGAGLGFLWGGLVRVFLVHHVTWSVNSICHIWGSRPFRSHDQSRNNIIVGVLGLGEGWHNNHHAFPTSARHGLRWWQLDISYLIIQGMALVGLASDVRLPSPERVAAKRA